MTRLTAAPSVEEAAAEIAHLSADLEPSLHGSASPLGEQGDFEATELPSFRTLPPVRRWRKGTEQAPPNEKPDAEATTDAEQVSWAEHEPQRRRAARKRLGRSAIREVIARSRTGHGSGLRRFVVHAGMLVLGIGIGLGIPYLTQIRDLAGGSHLERARAVASFGAAMLRRESTPTDSEANRARSGRGVVLESNSNAGQVDGLNSSPTDVALVGAKLSNDSAGGPLTSSDPHTRSDGQVLPRDGDNADGTDERNTALAALVEQAEREIANRQLEQPPGNNALETYHRIVVLSPQHPATNYVGERLSTTLWSLAMDAKAAEHWGEAVHYLDMLNTVPPVPAAAILARSRAPASPDSDAPGKAVEQPKAADSRPIGRADDMPTVPIPSTAAEKARLPEGPHAAATPSTKDVSQATGLLALNRGDAAMRSGDVLAARRYYQVSASAGVAGAANGVARTYDPIYLQQMGVRGVRADPEAAKHWYEKAIEDGDTEAGTNLNKLLDSLEKAPPRLRESIGFGSP